MAKTQRRKQSDKPEKIAVDNLNQSAQLGNPFEELHLDHKSCFPLPIRILFAHFDASF